MLTLEIDIESPWPETHDWVLLANRAAQAAAGVAPELANARLQASLIFTNDDDVQALNREWRDKDRPTNVLSFPMLTRDEVLTMAAKGPPELLGDIALAYETCAREAAEKNVPIEAHATHLIVHGLLHLAGHDHATSAAEADAMEALEIKALASLGLADPYADREPSDGATN